MTEAATFDDAPVLHPAEVAPAAPELVAAPTAAPVVAPLAAVTTPALPTAAEAIENLTGFDEIAIGQQFDSTIGQLWIEGKLSMVRRALLMIRYKNEGAASIKDAYKQAMNLRAGDLDAQFGEDPDDDEDDDSGDEDRVDELAGLSESGKDAR